MAAWERSKQQAEELEWLESASGTEQVSVCCINCAKAGTTPHFCQMVTGAPVWGQDSCAVLKVTPGLTFLASTELPSFPIPPTEHQQIRSRHGCNWKLENAALWYEAPLRELQEGIGKKKKNQKRQVGLLPELLTTVPVSLGGPWDSPVSHARHILSPDFLAGNVRGLHTQAVIQH